MQARGDEPREVSHVDEKWNLELLGDRSHGLEIPGARIGAAPADQHVRTQLERLLAQSIVIDALGLTVEFVVVTLVKRAAEVDLVPVGQMPPWVRLSPRILPPGLASAMNALRLAELPLWGWTLA